MIFTFWTEDREGGGGEAIPQAVTAWREQYPDTRLYCDDDAIQALAELDRRFVDLYTRIRIPACKSDLARLALLYKYGGLYIDIHAGPGDPQRVQDIVSKIPEYGIIIFDKTWERKFDNGIHLINGIIGARKGSEIIKKILDTVLMNLQQHDEKERATDTYVPYNLAVVTGAWNLRITLFDAIGDGVALKKELASRVLQIGIKRGEDCGIILYKYYSYRKEGRHWSERQKGERLFLRRDGPEEAGT